MWQIENCLGSIDGKHIIIKKPANSGSYYYNYKGTYSSVLFAIVNAKYEFIYVHSGTNGRVSDGGIWRQTSIYNRLVAGELGIPNPVQLPGTNDFVPFVFIGDEAFPLMEHLMKPYPQSNITHDQKIFNYRLCRARRVVENVFGILVSRFRIFLQPIAIDIEKIDTVVLACCALHNFLRKNSKNNYLTKSSVDYEDVNNGNIIPGDWRKNRNMLSIEKSKMTNTSLNVKEIRNKYKNFYIFVGRLTFQEKMI